MASIFISYRRTDGGYAGRIFDRLQRQFGSAAVFRDVDAIRDGTSFPEAIRHQLQTCRVFILVIGPGWHLARKENGRDRLDEAEDWVRLEISAALKQNACFIPVTVGGARMPAAQDLPEDLKTLSERQTRELRDGDTWDSDMTLLIRRIAPELGGRAKILTRYALGAVGVIVLVGGLILLVPKFLPNRAPITRANFTSAPIIIFENGNKQGVQNGPVAPTKFSIRQAHFVTHIYTYHWNNGNGSTPGRIRLQSAKGRVFGPWEARGTPGHNNAQNVNWVVEPNREIPAGDYTVVDSEPSTWSQNISSGSAGFTTIMGFPVNE